MGWLKRCFDKIFGKSEKKTGKLLNRFDITCFYFDFVDLIFLFRFQVKEEKIEEKKVEKKPKKGKTKAESPISFFKRKQEERLIKSNIVPKYQGRPQNGEERLVREMQRKRVIDASSQKLTDLKETHEDLHLRKKLLAYNMYRKALTID